MPAPKTETLQIIGKIRTPFKDKFGIPRQASLLNKVNAIIEFEPPFNNPDAFVGLDEFSHLWIFFSFHENDTNWRPMIRPPRLGGNKKIGVFASRSSFRPNGIGLSLVQLKHIEYVKESALLYISCPDVLDGTPIYDIKPFVEYADYPEFSRCAYADTAPDTKYSVLFSDSAKGFIESNNKHYDSDLSDLIENIVSLDPRPAYKKNKDDDKIYFIRLYDFEFSFSFNDHSVDIRDIRKLTTK